MRTLRIYFMFALGMLGASSFAQNGTDVLHLNDGSMIRGTIVEKITGSHVRIRTEEGEYRQYPMDQVAKTQMDADVPVAFKKIGYFNSTGIGLMMGLDEYGGLEANPSLQTVNGVYFGSHWQVGVGTGIEYVKQRGQVPVFIEGRFHLLDGEVSPYVGAQAGWQWPLQEAQPTYYYDLYAPQIAEKYYGGAMAGGEIGLRNVVKKHFGYNVSLGYRFQQDKRDVPTYFWNGSEPVYTTVLQRTTVHRICLKFGLMFN